MKNPRLTIEQRLALFAAGKALPPAPVDRAEEARADAAYAEYETRADDQSERGVEMARDAAADRIG